MRFASSSTGGGVSVFPGLQDAGPFVSTEGKGEEPQGA